MLALAFLVLLILFTTCFAWAMRGAGLQNRMEARFASLQAEGPGGLSPTADGLLKQTTSASGRLAALMARLRITPYLQRLFREAGQPPQSNQIPRLLFTCAGSAVAGAVLALLVLPMPLLMLFLAACGAYVPLFVLRFRGKRRIDAFNKALPECIEMMARALRAGHSVVAALGILAEQAPVATRVEWAEVFRQQNFGLPLREALLQMLERVPSQDLRVLVTGMLVQRDTGGNLTQILDRTAAVIRERLKLKGDIRVHTAQGRFTGWILCLLPVVMLLMINLISPGYSKTLTGDPIGRKLLYAGVGLLAAGAYMISKIVNGIEI